MPGPLTDREAIVELLARYARALDTRDWAALRECFTEDAQGEFSGVVLAPGVDAIVGHVAQLEQVEASTHLTGNVVVAFEGDRAQVESQALVHLLLGDRLRARGVFYSDVVVRSGDRWLIRERRHRAGWSIDLGGAHG